MSVSSGLDLACYLTSVSGTPKLKLGPSPWAQLLPRGKAKVTVKFQAHPGNIAGGLFGCQILKP